MVSLLLEMKVIKTNGKHDVTNFSTADVQVPIPEAPQGKRKSLLPKMA